LPVSVSDIGDIGSHLSRVSLICGCGPCTYASVETQRPSNRARARALSLSLSRYTCARARVSSLRPPVGLGVSHMFLSPPCRP